MQTSISAFVITKREKNIQNCLESLKWADEIIVVDAQSEDKTLEIAKKYTDKIFVRAWSGFSSQRNFALSHCTSDWVFFLDADEVCSPELISFFEKFKQSGPGQLSNLIHLCDAPHPKGVATKKEVSLIEVKRLEHFRGKFILWRKNPSYQWRLLNAKIASL
ncbi:MAG: glycosyltransferase family 2 protein [Oligoflexia bacterium]|nr:glycosyltransferase family 2 protein [Oligoflexia bacterium]